MVIEGERQTPRFLMYCISRFNLALRCIKALRRFQATLHSKFVLWGDDSLITAVRRCNALKLPRTQHLCRAIVSS